jgi:hypothetical protein
MKSICTAKMPNSKLRSETPGGHGQLRKQAKTNGSTELGLSHSRPEMQADAADLETYGTVNKAFERTNPETAAGSNGGTAWLSCPFLPLPEPLPADMNRRRNKERGRENPAV